MLSLAFSKATPHKAAGFVFHIDIKRIVQCCSGVYGGDRGV